MQEHEFPLPETLVKGTDGLDRSCQRAGLPKDSSYYFRKGGSVILLSGRAFSCHGDLTQERKAVYITLVQDFYAFFLRKLKLRKNSHF